MQRVLALVLAGGSGEELSVLTTERAVSAVPFGGKYRIIDFVLSNCCHSGIERVGLLTQHAPASLYDHIGSGRPWDLDRRSGGVLMLQPYLTRSDAGWYRGTADAVARNWDVVEGFAPSRVLILSGDHVYRMDYRRLLHTHEERQAAVTLAVARVPSDQSRRFGMATVDPAGRVLRLDEKPEHADTPFASMGIYLFETAALAEMLRDRPVDLVHDVVRPMLEAGASVHAHEFNGYWEDVGKIRSYYRANLDLLAGSPRLELHNPRWPLLTRDEERPPVLLGEDAVVEESLVANGCRVAGHVRRTVLFPGVRVEPGAEIVDAIVMQDTVVGRGAQVRHAIVDKHARIGAGAVVGRGAPPRRADVAALDGLTLVGKDAQIPDGGRVGRGVIIGISARPPEVPGEVPAGAVIGSRTWYQDVV